MTKHNTAHVECPDGANASVNIESGLKLAAATIALAITILGALAGVFAFAYGTKSVAEAAQKDATAAHVKVDKVEKQMAEGFNRVIDKMDKLEDRLYDRLTKE